MIRQDRYKATLPPGKLSRADLQKHHKSQAVVTSKDDAKKLPVLNNNEEPSVRDIEIASMTDFDQKAERHLDASAN